MDFSWTAGGLPSAHDAGVNLLDGDNLLLDLDDKTLQCLVGSATLPPASHDAEAGPSDCSKRRRRDDDFASWMAEGQFARAEGDVGGEEGDDDSAGDEGGCVKRKGRKRAVPDAAAAKATREKARRERLNEYFDDLSRLCDPSGKGVKADRVSVVADAIRVVQQLRVENNQLRQLNKFLEERTAAYERQKAQSMFQAAAAAAHQHQAAAPPAPPAQLQAAQLQAQWEQLQLQQHQAAQQAAQQAQQAQQPQFAAAQAGAGVSIAHATALPYGACEVQELAFPAAPQGGVQHMLVQIPLHSAPGSLGAQLLALKQELPPGAAPVSWLPAPDLSEDQKLRPPAA